MPQRPIFVRHDVKRFVAANRRAVGAVARKLDTKVNLAWTGINPLVVVPTRYDANLGLGLRATRHTCRSPRGAA